MTTKTTTSKPVTLVVRRGALRRFDRLKQATRELPAEVVWDRRQPRASREAAAEVVQPANNRRKATPSTWELADFAVVQSAPPGRSRGARTKKS